MRVLILTYLLTNILVGMGFGQNTSDSIPNALLSRPDTNTRSVFRSSNITNFNSPIVLNSGLICYFAQSDINLNKVDFISNVLKVYNTGSSPVAFYFELGLPAAWQLITKNDRYYTALPRDTIYIPIRIVPRDFKKTSVNYTITAVLISEDGYQIGDASFLAHTTKISKWEITALPREINYFKNNQKEVPFAINIYNNGNTNQSILFYFKETRKKSVVTDENGKIVNDKKKEFKLLPGEDTTLKFIFTQFTEKRNLTRVDIENHLPNMNTIERKYSLLAFTKDAELNNKGGYIRSKRLTFVRLPNQTKMSPFGYASLPVIMDLNIFNIGAYQPVANLVLRGNAALEKGGSLTYFFQNNFSSYFGRQPFLNSAFTLGYSKNRLNVNVGNIGGIGIGTVNFGVVGGRGINASYRIGNNHRVGAYYARGPQFFNPFFGSQNMGTFYIYAGRKLRAGASVGYQNNNVRDQQAVTFGATANYNFKRIHSFALSGGGRYIFQTPTPLLTPWDWGFNVRYNGAVNKKHQEMINVNYFEYASQNPIQIRMNLIHRSQLNYIKKYPLTLTNNYIERVTGLRQSNGNYQNIFSRLIGNTLATGISLKNGGVVSPNVFYNFIQIRSLWGHSRGGGFAYAFFNPDTRLRFTYFAQGGYNLLPGQGLPNTFFFRTAAITQYQTLTLNVRYNYGTGVMDTINTFYTSRYPQSLGINASYQYLFRDQRFLFIPFINYTYVNVRNRHSIGFFPDFYFYSYSGWRFRLSVGTNLSFTERVSLNQLINPNAPKEERWKRSGGFVFTLGIRKAFGIPIPKKFTKQQFASPTIICFYDFNGNKIYDPSELTIENVVIAIGETRVLSNEDGKAVIENIPAGKYKYQVFALEDLGTWYPLYEDSIVITDQKKLFVPFVKGVRITGKVVIDREKFASDVEKLLDLGKIKITATDSIGKVYTGLTNNKGDFELFVPYGKYTLHMDESVLGSDRFKLLRNDYMVELKEGVDGIFHTFYIVERKRRLAKKKFGPDGKIIEETIEEQKNGKNGNGSKINGNGNGNDNLNNNNNNRNLDNNNNKAPGNTSGQNNTTGQNNNPLDPEKIKIDPRNYTPEQLEQMRNEFLKNTIPSNQLQGTVFTVQLGAFALPVKPDAFKMVPEQLISERLPNGLIRVSTGQFKTYQEAEEYQKLLYSIGYTAEDYIVAYVNGQYRNPAQARRIR